MSSEQMTEQLEGVEETPSPEHSEESLPAEVVETISAESVVVDAATGATSDLAHTKAIIEAMIYITDEPLTALQIAGALGQPMESIRPVLDELAADYARPDRGLSIREVAGGFKMATKPEHHEEIRQFVKNLKPPLKLSLAALETLAVIAYKQPITAPEIMEIRGVQGAGVLKTLLDRKLIATAGRKNVIGKPILYKTTRDFLVQFGLKDLSELPTLKEFEELGRLALTDADETPEPPAQAPPPPASEPQPDGADQPLENTAADPASTVDADRPLGEAVVPDIDDKSIPGIPGEPEPDQPEPPIGPPGPPPEPIEEPPAPVIPQQTDPSSEPNA